MAEVPPITNEVPEDFLKYVHALRPDLPRTFGPKAILPPVSVSEDVVAYLWRQAQFPHFHYEALEPRNPSDEMLASTTTLTFEFTLLGLHPEWGAIMLDSGGQSLTHVKISNEKRAFYS